MDMFLQWSNQGLAIIGTDSPDEAARVWRDHLETQVDPALHEELALGRDAWDGAQRMWALPPDDTLLSGERVRDAKPALLLSGLPDAFTAAGT